jgi:hypothetical protein
MLAKKSSKPFCKVCFDTGKSENEYRSHYVKNIPGPNGVVVCPTILSVECRYCKSIGHTVSKCPSLKSKSSYHHHDKKFKSNRTNHYHNEDNHLEQSVIHNTPTSTVDIEGEIEEDKSMDICVDNNKYEVSYANMVLKQPPIVTTVKNTIVKEKKKFKKLSIIDPSTLDNNSNTVHSLNKSYTPPYPPPSFKPRIENGKPGSKSNGFKTKQVIIHRWADDVETDMSDYE